MIGYNEEVLDLSFASETCLAVCTNSDNLRIFDTQTRSCRLLYGHKVRRWSSMRMMMMMMMMTMMMTMMMMMMRRRRRRRRRRNSRM